MDRRNQMTSPPTEPKIERDKWWQQEVEQRKQRYRQKECMETAITNTRRDQAQRAVDMDSATDGRMGKIMETVDDKHST